MTQPSSSSSSYSPTPLSLQQNHWLNGLWKTNGRELADVIPTLEPEGLLTGQNLSKAKNPHTYSFCLRLHGFFVALLHCALYPEEEHHHIPNPTQSCFSHYIQHALSHHPRTTSSSPQTRQQRESLPSIPPKASGRMIFTVSQQEFFQQFQHYELQGQAPSDEYIRRDSFGAFLYHVPSQALAALSCALALAMLTVSVPNAATSSSTAQLSLSHEEQGRVNRFVSSTQLRVQFLHVQPVVPMLDIKTGLVGKLLTVRGHVIKARPRRLKLAAADFICKTCGAQITHVWPDEAVHLSAHDASSSSGGASSVEGPTRCAPAVDGQVRCKGRSFALLRPMVARYVNVQELCLQEQPEESQNQAGRTPRQIRIMVSHCLVDSCRAGDAVAVAAIVSATNTAAVRGAPRGRGQKRALQENSTYDLYLVGHSITTMSESHHGTKQSQNQGSSTSAFTQKQLQNIVKLCHADHRYFGLVERRAFPFDLLVRSMCPTIIGHDLVKAGLVLCLLGGTPAATGGAVGTTGGSANDAHSIRSNSHMLIVGDPGMGKSQMLLAANQLAARSVYVGGNTSSTTGLTVTLSKEEKGESGIEAGALVLADQGVCFIDEFDKMAKNHQDGLLEAMEQQNVSIAKAGVVASLPARCSVIAAANPRHGSYNMSQTVAENLNMNKPILSRFDLVFILRDCADQAQDRLVSSNIMNLYRNTSSKGAVPSNMNPSTFSHENGAPIPGSTMDGASENRMSLSDRLAWVANLQKTPLPADLLRDYIAYAREYCRPKLTAEAAVVLKEFFMELRYPSDGRRKNDTVPITTRQLEALIRLCQARAKACLRDFCLREDALDVVELMRRSVEQIHTDEAGMIDPARGGAGGKSKRRQKKAFINELVTIIGVGATCSTDDLRKIALRLKVDLHDFTGFVEDLRSSGILLKKGNGLFEILS